MSIPVGENQLFKCEFDGRPTPQVRWLYQGEPLEASERFVFDEEGAELTLMDAHAEDSGRYTCEGINRAGTAAYNVSLLVGGLYMYLMH